MPQGGRLSKEMPVDVSNVLLICPACRRGVRVGRRYTAEGRKERYCKKCGGSLGVLEQAAREVRGEAAAAVVTEQFAWIRSQAASATS